ncbi:MAG: VTT domain-containing protein [Candidatus Bathyarchaeia archaeon]
MSFEDIVNWLFAIAVSYGYFGAFLMSFLGSLVFFIPIPYWLIVIWLTAPVFGLNPTILALTSALGATCGKLVSYYIGFFSRRVVSEKRQNQLDFARKVMNKYGAIAIFIMAVTPSPDDALYIPLGMMKYNPLNFLILCFIGKFLLTLTITWGGRYFLSYIPMVFSTVGAIAGMVITLGFVILSVYATMKIDWEKIFMKYVAEKVMDP